MFANKVTISLCLLANKFTKWNTTIFLISSLDNIICLCLLQLTLCDSSVVKVTLERFL